MNLKKIILITLFLFEAIFLVAQQKEYILRYNKPAKDWNEALSIGNGRLGAMIFGRAGEELIQLNEQTLWTSGPANLNPNPEAPCPLPGKRGMCERARTSERGQVATFIAPPFRAGNKIKNPILRGL